MIYMIGRTSFVIAAIPIAFLLIGMVATGPKAQAWDGGYGFWGFHHWHHFGLGDCCFGNGQSEGLWNQGCCNSGLQSDCCNGPSVCGNYCDNNYNQCDSCNNLPNNNQQQESTQGSSVNVNNSPAAYVSVNQNQGQTQNQLTQLGHDLCNLINCQSQQDP